MTGLVDLDRLTERLSLQDWRAARGDMYRVINEAREARSEVARLTAAISRIRADTMRFAADEVRREARWQKETQSRGMFANGETSIDRLLMFETILRKTAADLVGEEVTQP